MAAIVYIIVGEPSGDILASRMMIALKKREPDLSFAGIGGETMRAQGFESLFDISELSVMGFWEVVPRLSLILKRMRQVMADIEMRRPDVVVTVDSWGFVSSILQKLKKRRIKIPVVHYVAPQVWAWKKGRAPKAAKLMDRLMTLWPYEPSYFEKYGLRCDFVGHPVVENIGRFTDHSAEWKARHRISETCTLLCVLPGSRHSEVKRLIPVFKRVIVRLQAHYPDLFVVIPSVEAIADEVRLAFADMSTPHCIIKGQQERYQAFCDSRFALAASGTVTLELTACGTPHVIAYRFNRWTNWLVKRFVTTPYANLINILASKPVIPEFVLSKCREDLIYDGVLTLMQNQAMMREQVAQAQQCLVQLKPADMMPSEKAAAVVLEEVHRPNMEAYK